METKWQCDLTSTKERQSQLLERRCFTDVTFAVGSGLKKIRAHKLILSAASPVFAEMLYGNSENSEIYQPKFLVTVVDIEPGLFEQMLKYIYTEAIDFDSCKNAVELYHVSKKYMMNGLERSCIEFFFSELKPSNALKLFRLAKLFEKEFVEEQVLRFISSRTITVLDHLEFTDIEDLVMILEQNELQTTEYEIFQALNSLAISKIVNKPDTDNNGNKNKLRDIDIVRIVVKKIQFYTMTLEQFLNGPAMSGLLLPEEKSAISACINKPFLLKELYPMDFAQNLRQPKNLPHIFFDIRADGSAIGRIVVQLRPDVVPKTVKKFLSHCNGENFTGLRGSCFHYISSDCCKAINKRGWYPEIESENYVLKNKEPGTVGLLYNSDNKNITRCDGFIITFRNRVDHERVFIGNVVKGMDVVEAIELYGTQSGRPLKAVLIENCGKLKM